MLSYTLFSWFSLVGLKKYVCWQGGRAPEKKEFSDNFPEKSTRNLSGLRENQKHSQKSILMNSHKNTYWNPQKKNRETLRGFPAEYVLVWMPRANLISCLDRDIQRKISEKFWKQLQYNAHIDSHKEFLEDLNKIILRGIPKKNHRCISKGIVKRLTEIPISSSLEIFKNDSQKKFPKNQIFE